jgi:hypothetical protein
VGGLLHHHPGERDGVLDRLQARHRAAGEIAAVHDGGVELMGALVGEDRALAGVEQRIVLQEADHLLHRVQAGAAAREHLATDLQRRVERLQVRLLLALRDVLGDRARPAMDGERPGWSLGGHLRRLGRHESGEDGEEKEKPEEFGDLHKRGFYSRRSKTTVWSSY